MHDPFTMLREMTKASLITMRDVGLANAGIIYARPGIASYRLLSETAWRIQMMNNWPEVVPRIVPFVKTPPFYANSDDQTLLNDAIVSAIIGNRTFLGSTARYEARNRYNPKGVDWGSVPESKAEGQQMRAFWRAQRAYLTPIPWGDGQAKTKHLLFPLKGTEDAVVLASRVLFAHLPFAPGAAITHLTAARGFNAKVSTLQRINAWYPDGNQWGGDGSSATFDAVKTKAVGKAGGGRGGGAIGKAVGGRGASAKVAGGRGASGKAAGGRGGGHLRFPPKEKPTGSGTHPHGHAFAKKKGLAESHAGSATAEGGDQVAAGAT